MAGHIIYLTDEDEVAFAAYVRATQKEANADPRPFPPITAAESVEALLDSFMDPPRQLMRQWVKDHPEALHDEG